MGNAKLKELSQHSDPSFDQVLKQEAEAIAKEHGLPHQSVLKVLQKTARYFHANDDQKGIYNEVRAKDLRKFQATELTLRIDSKAQNVLAGPNASRFLDLAESNDPRTLLGYDGVFHQWLWKYPLLVERQKLVQLLGSYVTLLNQNKESLLSIGLVPKSQECNWLDSHITTFYPGQRVFAENIQVPDLGKILNFKIKCIEQFERDLTNGSSDLFQEFFKRLLQTFSSEEIKQAINYSIAFIRHNPDPGYGTFFGLIELTKLLHGEAKSKAYESTRKILGEILPAESNSFIQFPYKTIFAAPTNHWLLLYKAITNCLYLRTEVALPEERMIRDRLRSILESKEAYQVLARNMESTVPEINQQILELVFEKGRYHIVHNGEKFSLTKQEASIFKYVKDNPGKTKRQIFNHLGIPTTNRFFLDTFKTFTKKHSTPMETFIEEERDPSCKEDSIYKIRKS